MHDAADRHSGRDQTQTLGEVCAGVLIQNGTVDCLCPCEIAERLRAAIIGAQLRLYANEDYIPWIKQPDQFFVEMIRFTSTNIR